MKASKEFILREIAGEHILVPIGTAAANFNGLISMNEVGRSVSYTHLTLPTTCDV